MENKRSYKITFNIILLLFFLFSNISLSVAQPHTKFASSSKEAKITDKINLSEQDIEIFKERTKRKISEFQQHIITICNKEEPMEKRIMAERESLKLFYKGAVMETSYIDESGQVKTISRPIEEYLARLKSLPYIKVVIKFYDIVYIRDFTLGPDGKYYSTATIFQKFVGFNGDNIVYSDITEKEIEIIIDLVEDKFYNEKHWKVFLGDIKVTETKQS